MANRSATTLAQVVGESIGVPSATGRGAYLSLLAINEAIDAVNRRPFWFLVSLANFTLTTSAKTYVLSTSWPNFKTHIASVLLNSGETDKERDLMFIAQPDFFRARYETGPYTGPPSALTADQFNDLIRIDTTPGAGYNGRKVRTLYYRKLSRLAIGTSTLGIDDSGEDLVVQDAMWRAMARAKLSGWQEQKRVAEETRREMLATPESVDFNALGFW